MLWNISTIWLITFTRNAFDTPEINADLFVYIWDVTFEIRAFIKQAIPLKNESTCWSTVISYMCRTFFIFMGKDSVHLKSAFKHTAWSTSLSPRDADDAGLTKHYELPMEKKVPWNGAVSMRSRVGSRETLSICIKLRHNQGAPADMHANALGILIICRFPPA